MAKAAKHLVFVWKTSGYELSERSGEVPAPGSEVEEGEQRFVVVRVGPSPLPADERRCAYLQPL
jgi:hypothetical protein